MTLKELRNEPMYKDLLDFAKAINFKMESKEQIKELLKLWVNHRVELTPQIMDYIFNDYCNKKNIITE